jgi:hypothetical protein
MTVIMLKADICPLPVDEAIRDPIGQFRNLPNPNNTSGRKYVLELEEGELVFRRDEFCLAFESAFKGAVNEVFGPDQDDGGDDIVPQKLSKLFPGRHRSQDA